MFSSVNFTASLIYLSVQWRQLENAPNSTSGVNEWKEMLHQLIGYFYQIRKSDTIPAKYYLELNLLQLVIIIKNVGKVDMVNDVDLMSLLLTFNRFHTL